MGWASIDGLPRTPVMGPRRIVTPCVIIGFHRRLSAAQLNGHRSDLAV